MKKSHIYYEMHFGDTTTKAFKTLKDAQNYARQIDRPAIDIYEVVTKYELIN